MNLNDYVSRIQTAEPVSGVHLFVDQRKGTGYVHAALAIEAGLSRTTPDARGLAMVLPHLLEEGTTSRSRDTLRSELEGLGSDIRYDVSSDHLFARIEGRADAFTATMNIVSDMLLHSVFNEESLATVVTRLISEYGEDKEDTRKLAYAAATNALFEKDSSLRALFPEEKIAAVRAVTSDGLKAHAKEVLRGPMTVVIAGDISLEDAVSAVRAQFTDWNVTPSSMQSLPVRPRLSSKDAPFLEVPNKENVDVFLVSATPVLAKDPLYVSLSVANELLGSGGFTGHLMKTVRERDGLTYGIYSRLRDVSSRLPLMIAVSATFGSSLYERGLLQTKKEMEIWLAQCITKANLEKKKIEILGSYMVSLQDPEDVVWQIISLLASGRPLSDVAKYPEKVQALSVAEVREAASKYFSVKNFVIGMAGQKSNTP